MMHLMPPIFNHSVYTCFMIGMWNVNNSILIFVRFNYCFIQFVHINVKRCVHINYYKEPDMIVDCVLIKK